MPLPSMGLYYPYIHFRDESWLKAAALYWPRMARIVPAGYPTRDSQLVQSLAGELDFVLPISPTAAAGSVAGRVGDLISEHADHLKADYHVDTTTTTTGVTDDEVDVEWSMRDTSLGLEPRSWKLAGVHVDYVDPALRDQLVDLGVAVDVAPWLAMHPHLAWVYMCMLAQELADSNSLLPTTDQLAAHAASPAWNPDRVDLTTVLGLDGAGNLPPAAARAGRVADTLGLLAVRLAVPAGLADVPVSQIITIRRRYRSEFDAFSAALGEAADSLAQQLAHVRDPGVVTAYVEQEVQRRFEGPLRELRAVLRGQGLDVAFAVANVKVELPAITLAAGSLVGQPVIASAAAAAVGLFQAFHSTRVRRAETLKPAPASYLLHVSAHAHEAAPGALLARLGRRINRRV